MRQSCLVFLDVDSVILSIFFKKENIIILRESPRNESHGLLLSLITFVSWYPVVDKYVNEVTLDCTVSLLFFSPFQDAALLP